MRLTPLKTLSALCLAAVLIIGLSSCSSTTAPTKVERVLFDTTTNVASNTTNYGLVPKPVDTAVVQGAGAVLNTFLPGTGTIFATIATALLGGWSTWRSRAKGQAIGTTLTQEIETAKAIIGALPNGQALLAQFSTFLVTHQADANLLSEISALVTNQTDTPQANAVAAGMLAKVNVPLK